MSKKIKIATTFDEIQEHELSKVILDNPYLQQFVNRFTEANQGKAFYTGLKGLGEMIFEDYETNRKKRIK